MLFPLINWGCFSSEVVDFGHYKNVTVPSLCCVDCEEDFRLCSELFLNEGEVWKYVYIWIFNTSSVLKAVYHCTRMNSTEQYQIYVIALEVT